MKIISLFLLVVPVLCSDTPAWRNIRDFGAVGDGTTDDTAAIQAAFNSLDPIRGGTVYCPPGTYAVYRQITITGGSVRFAGDAGTAYNEGTESNTGRGCSLWAKSNGMTLLKFDGRQGDFHGPIIEYVNLRDVTPHGHSVMLLWIFRYTRWTVRNVYVGYSDVGLRVDGGPIAERGDASWGYVSQMVCRSAKTCIDEPNPWGGFVATGGDFEPLITGVRVAGDQVRVIGAKFDCLNGATGVFIAGGSANVISSSLFEQCGTSVRIRSDGTAGSGMVNRIIGNHFSQWYSGTSIGVDIGPNAADTQLLGNTYQYYNANIAVVDQGKSTKRYEQGVGTSSTLTCPGGQAVKSIAVKEGIVTGVTCGPL